MKGFKEAIRIISISRDIIIAGHINPDGDSIGSLLSLGLGIKQLGKNVQMLSAGGVPKKYRVLPGAGEIIRNSDKAADLAIAVDCSTKELLGKTFTLFKKCRYILEIDHHSVRDPFGDISLVKTQAAAVGELVYSLLKRLRVAMTRDIAQNILTSIIVETNSFRLPNVQPFTFEVCAKLLKTGLDFHKLSETIYWSRGKESSVITGLILSKCKFLSQDRIVWSFLTRKDLKVIKANYEDTEAIANEMLAIKSVEVALLFREIGEDLLKVHLRSKGKVDVALFAQKYGGGGHADAAACVVRDGNKTIKNLLKKITELI